MRTQLNLNDTKEYIVVGFKRVKFYRSRSTLTQRQVFEIYTKDGTTPILGTQSLFLIDPSKEEMLHKLFETGNSTRYQVSTIADYEMNIKGVHKLKEVV